MTHEELFERIKYVEDKDMNINPNWYYHAVSFSKEVYKDILTRGIRATVLREDDKAGKTNGKYYVCLAKNLNKGEGSLFDCVMVTSNFVIDESIKTFNMSNLRVFEIFEDTILPFRYCDGDPEERQVFLRVPPKKIVALQYSISKWANDDRYDKEYKYEWGRIKNLVNVLEELNKDLPLFDYNSGKEINKEKVLKLGN